MRSKYATEYPSISTRDCHIYMYCVQLKVGGLIWSRDQRDIPTENPSGNVGAGAFVLSTELFECANQIVTCPIITRW